MMKRAAELVFGNQSQESFPTQVRSEERTRTWGAGL
jgi:hypothetical protein